MKKKLFYISSCLEDKNYGGSVVAKSNLEAILNLSDYSISAFAVNRSESKNYIKVPSTKSKVGTALANMSLLCATLSPMGAFFLLKSINKEKPNIVWLDSSLFGILIPAIRFLSKESKIICYFHNIETPISKAYAKRNPYYWVSFLATWTNEQLTIRNSDVLIAIQRDDESTLRRAKTDALIFHVPASLKDNFNIDHNPNTVSISDTSYVLFVGSDFPPNIEALSYLNSKIAPYLRKRKIIAVGNGIEKYANQFKNLDIHGSVEDLKIYYTQADLVLAPIFSGGGMKVKIAEALMFNKAVLASSFAAIGYELVPENILLRIDNDEILINTIEHHKIEVNSEPRKYYLKLFSPQSIRNSIKQIINLIDNKP